LPTVATPATAAAAAAFVGSDAVRSDTGFDDDDADVKGTMPTRRRRRHTRRGSVCMMEVEVMNEEE
jgi:hypothetical protein